MLSTKRYKRRENVQSGRTSYPLQEIAVEGQKLPDLELISCSGYGQNGSLCIFQVKKTSVHHFACIIVNGLLWRSDMYGLLVHSRLTSQIVKLYGPSSVARNIFSKGFK